MYILQIVGLGLVATFLALLLQEHNQTYALLFLVFVSVLIFLFLVERVGDMIETIRQLAARTHVEMMYVELLLKIIGIAYVTEFATQVTKDAGLSSLGGKIELAGKIMILSFALPIFTAVIETILTFLEQVS